MSHELTGPPLARYLVEVAAPETGWRDIQSLAARSRKASEDVREGGARVRFLRSVFVPEDGSCFLLYEAESAEAVSDAAAHAELSVVNVAQSMRLEP